MDRDSFFTPGGKPLVGALFYEASADKSRAVYTIMETDREAGGVIYPSLKQLYLEKRDPVEYLFVRDHLGSWSQWEQLSSSKTVVNNKTLETWVSEWRKELELLIMAEAVKNVATLANQSNGFQAAKFLADRGWSTKKKATTSEKKKIREQLGDDAARVGLSIVNN